MTLQTLREFADKINKMVEEGYGDLPVYLDAFEAQQDDAQEFIALDQHMN